MAKKERPKKAWELMNEELREAFEVNGFSVNDFVSEILTLYNSPMTRPADKTRIAELISKWSGLNAPEKHDVTVKDTKIGVKLPEDLDL